LAGQVDPPTNFWNRTSYQPILPDPDLIE